MNINKKAHQEQIPEYWIISRHLFSCMKKIRLTLSVTSFKRISITHTKKSEQLWQAELPEQSHIGAAKYAELSYRAACHNFIW